MGEKYFGVDFAHIERVTAIAEPPLGRTQFYAVILQADREFDFGRFAPELTRHTVPGQIYDRPCLVSKHPTLPCWMIVKQKVLIGASRATLEKLLDQRREKNQGVPAKLVANHPPSDDLYVGVDVAALREWLKFGLMRARLEAPEDTRRFFHIPYLVQSAELTFNLGTARRSSLMAHAATKSDADQLELLLDEAIQLAKTRMRSSWGAQFDKLLGSEDPIKRATAAYGDRMSNTFAGLVRPARQDNSFVVTDKARLSNAAKFAVWVDVIVSAIEAAWGGAARPQRAEYSISFRSSGLVRSACHLTKSSTARRCSCDRTNAASASRLCQGLHCAPSLLLRLTVGTREVTSFGPGTFNPWVERSNYSVLKTRAAFGVDPVRSDCPTQICEGRFRLSFASRIATPYRTFEPICCHRCRNLGPLQSHCSRAN
jgi:hypothetical protein